MRASTRACEKGCGGLTSSFRTRRRSSLADIRGYHAPTGSLDEVVTDLGVGKLAIYHSDQLAMQPGYIHGGA
jgi:hypothetical protein